MNEDDISSDIGAPGNNKIFLAEPVHLFLRVWMIAFGIVQFLCGLFNYGTTKEYALFQMGLGLSSILFFLLIRKQINTDLYISWDEEDLIFRIKLFKKPVHIKWNEIENITESNCRLCIDYRGESYVLKYSDLTYLQRKKYLTNLLESVRNHVDESNRKFSD